MGDVDEGLSRLPLDVLQLLLQRLAQAIVEGRQRFVEEQDLGIVGERAGQRHALPLAARALRHRAVVVVGRKVGERKAFGGPLAPLLLAHAAALQRIGDVLADGHVGKKGQRLEHHAERALVGRRFVDARAAQQDLPARRAVHAHEHSDESGLPRAGRPDDGEELALGDLEIHALHRDEAVEDPVHVAEFKNGLRHAPVSRRSRRPSRAVTRGGTRKGGWRGGASPPRPAIRTRASAWPRCRGRASRRSRG